MGYDFQKSTKNFGDSINNYTFSKYNIVNNISVYYDDGTEKYLHFTHIDYDI